MFTAGARDPLTELLYLLAYSLAVLGLLLPVFLGRSRGRGGGRARALGRFLQASAFTGVAASLQIILDGFGITEAMPGEWPVTLNFVFNELILVGLWGAAAAWYGAARSISPAPFPADRISRYVMTGSLGVLALNIAGQALAFLRPGEVSFRVARYALAAFFVVLVALFLAGTIRIYRRKAKNAVAPIPRLPRVIPALLVIFILLLVILPGRLSSVALPVMLMALLGVTLAALLRENSEAANPASAREIFFDESGMSPREREIALLLAEGLSYKEIGSRLFLSLSTVQTHVTRIYGKTGVNSKTELSRLLSGSPAP